MIQNIEFNFIFIFIRDSFLCQANQSPSSPLNRLAYLSSPHNIHCPELHPQKQRYRFILYCTVIGCSTLVTTFIDADDLSRSFSTRSPLYNTYCNNVRKRAPWVVPIAGHNLNTHTVAFSETFFHSTQIPHVCPWVNHTWANILIPPLYFVLICSTLSLPTSTTPIYEKMRPPPGPRWPGTPNWTTLDGYMVCLCLCWNHHHCTSPSQRVI